ncbi:hypothetical protein ASE01_20845 [Nocardioides sp. Root190]|uniref:hypothetical protein n=1 Tax=Nocardioides sp. Root190 TaxID=1736488 RepID=UPI0006F6B194|nr:hypothetical protein [Nocardioides sp. Root190]KRB73208.1 hypothetical protein ASE01_20845 [Nocardioides sp. Root190]
MSEPPSEWRTYGQQPSSPYDAGGTFTPYDARGQQRRTRTRAGGLLLGFAGIVVGLGVGGWAVMSALGGGDEAGTSTTTVITDTDIRSDTDTWTSTGSDVDLFTNQGMADLAFAIEEATGSTDVLQAVVFQGNAVVTVPAEDARSQPRVFQWNGQLTPAGTTMVPNEPFDLLDLEGGVLGELCGPEPLACTAVAARPLPTDRGVWLKVASPSGARLTDLRGNPA